MTEITHWFDVIETVFGVFYAFFGSTKDVRVNDKIIADWMQFLARLAIPFMWLGMILATSRSQHEGASS